MANLWQPVLREIGDRANIPKVFTTIISFHSSPFLGGRSWFVVRSTDRKMWKALIYYSEGRKINHHVTSVVLTALPL